jgi:hypothetical protein
MTLAVDRNVLESAIRLLADSSLVDDKLDKLATSLHEDSMTIRRLLDWPPEAFGLVLIGHKWSLTLPQTFFAKDTRGRIREFPFTSEPIFAECVDIACQMLHNNDDRQGFTAIASRGAMLDTVHNAMEAGSKIDGRVLSGPILLGIPAEVYSSETRSPFQWLTRLFR